MKWFKWLGMLVLILGGVGIGGGWMMVIAPGFFQLGLVMLLLGMGVALAGFILFMLMRALAKMAPPG